MGRFDITTELLTDGGQNTFETEYTTRPPSIALVESIAAIEGVPPTDVDFPLYESVDPDALDILFADPEDDETPDDGEIVVEFRVNGYMVQIRNNGRITVKDTNQSE